MIDPGDTIAWRERTGGTLIVSTITIAEIRGDLLIVLHGGARNGDEWGPTSPIPMRRSEWEAIADRSWTRIPAPWWWGKNRPLIDRDRLMALAYDHDLRVMIDVEIREVAPHLKEIEREIQSFHRRNPYVRSRRLCGQRGGRDRPSAGPA